MHMEVSSVITQANKAILLLFFQGDLHRFRMLDKALVYVLLVRDGTGDNTGLKGELNELLELSPDDA